MNLQQRRIAALTMSVKKAVISIGLNRINSSEFFGMKQAKKRKSVRKAA